MKTATLLAVLLAPGAAVAQDSLWVPADQTTPQSLLASGAELLSADSVAWPEGGDVAISYWLAADDLKFRCAELRIEDVARASCWTLATAARQPDEGGRIYTTRRRAAYVEVPFYPPLYPPIYPQIWLGGWRWPGQPQLP